MRKLSFKNAKHVRFCSLLTKAGGFVKQNEREKYTILIFENVLKLIFNKQNHG